MRCLNPDCRVIEYNTGEWEGCEEEDATAWSALAATDCPGCSEMGV